MGTYSGGSLAAGRTTHREVAAKEILALQVEGSGVGLTSSACNNLNDWAKAIQKKKKKKQQLC
jgi:hypothetical protein